MMGGNIHNHKNSEKSKANIPEEKPKIERWYSLDVFGAANGKKELLYKRFGRFNSLIFSEDKAAELFEKHNDIAFVDIYEFITDEHFKYAERIAKTVIRSDFEKKEPEIASIDAHTMESIREHLIGKLKTEILSTKNIRTPDIFALVDRAFEIGKGEF